MRINYIVICIFSIMIVVCVSCVSSDNPINLDSTSIKRTQSEKTSEGKTSINSIEGKISRMQELELPIQASLGPSNEKILDCEVVYKLWDVEKLKGKTVVLVLSSLTNYRKALITPHIQGLLLDLGFKLIDTALSETVLGILEEQAKPQYIDTSKNLGEWVPADLIVYIDIKMKEKYKSIEGSDGKNYWIAESIVFKLIDVKTNTVVSNLAAINVTSIEQMNERTFIGTIVKFIRENLEE